MARYHRWLFPLVTMIWPAGLTAQVPPQGVAPSTQAESRPEAKAAKRASKAVKTTPSGKFSGKVNIEQVKFTTEDQLVIAADFVEPPTNKDAKAPIAILLHMYKSNRSAYAPLIKPLHVRGFAVLAIDMRGHGDSVGPPEMKLANRVTQKDRNLFGQMHKDVEAAYQWLRERPDVDLARFVIVGASVGCSVALDYASRDPSVDGVVCMTPGTMYLGLNSIPHVVKYGQRPLLMLASEKERSASDKLFKVASQATVKIFPDKLILGPMGLHGTRMFGQVAGVEKLIVDFMAASVGPPSTELVVASIKGTVYYDPDSSQARRLSRKNLRWFSSPTEAQARGFRPPKSRTRSKTKGAKDDSQSTGHMGEPFPDPN